MMDNGWCGETCVSFSKWVWEEEEKNISGLVGLAFGLIDMLESKQRGCERWRADRFGWWWLYIQTKHRCCTYSFLGPKKWDSSRIIMIFCILYHVNLPISTWNKWKFTSFPPAPPCSHASTINSSITQKNKREIPSEPNFPCGSARKWRKIWPKVQAMGG